ncbi:MAG: hypothetical protein NUW37_18930 [Planctomycetes bacterium]|nr:hypothetical protein [Planctomycetota bacterium]
MIAGYYQQFRKIVDEDPRYNVFAYELVMESFSHLPKPVSMSLAEEYHLTGREYLELFRDHVKNIYGPLARPVLSSVGINCCADVGNVVFNLVNKGLIRSRPEDSIDDFEEIFDFGETFGG